MTEIFTAKTVEEAKELAAKKFGKKISEIKFEIIDEGKKGFLGLGKSDAKVKAVFVEKAEPVKAEAPVKTETAKAAEPVAAETVKSAEPVKTEEMAVSAETEPVKVEETAISEKATEPESAENDDKTDDSDEYSIENFTLIEDQSLVHPKVKIAQDYITSILRAMDVTAEFTVYQNETGAIINIESDNNGTIIGRRGETLDSLQYLCSIIANKGDKDYFRITIDCFGYRSKRKETLEQLAVKVAKSVLRTGRSQPLEPMNPYERRVIHSAISEIEGVSSRSVGEEPYRKIIISSNNPRKKRDNRRDGGRRNDRNRDNRRNDKGEITLERKSVNLSTSFEKDYKRPRPEDSIEGGLYGKIEL